MITRFPLLLLCLLFTAACGRLGDRAASGTTLATVNGTAITTGDLDFLASVGPPALKAELTTPEGKQRLVNDLIDRELLHAESVRLGLHRDPRVQREIDLHRRVLLANAALRDAVRNAARAHFNAHPGEFTVVGLRHLLVAFGTTRTEQDAVTLANGLRERIAGGATFADMARAHSDDATTREHGGWLGLVWRTTPHLMRRGYEGLLEKAFTMQPGDVAGPFKTKDGYHLLAIDSAPRQQTFAEVQERLEFRFLRDTRTTLLTTLRAKAKIQRHLPDTAPVKPAEPLRDHHEHPHE